ncbi:MULTISPECIES: hypothetical protein [unclassified Spirosoma]|uniref:hypothetical protein n=1 Tax=unclassified Spirosoma TaxID=2621999 RepID=UPI0009665D2E|nr:MULTISPECIES: hypothetical protein [unclassified Spirosoma]MBN8825023.1 hypothetical protein [Spirosoma sp.]OJW73317.1 MAG: hypothetical protein BGO59_07520 [Spirosoma sp. 48-14]
MKIQLLFCALIGVLTACQHESDIQPSTSSLASEAVGTYRTNFYLDPSYVALSPGQMPYVELKQESDSNVTLLLNKPYPSSETKAISHVRLQRKSDGVELQVANTSIGTLQTDRVFTNSGMEKQGQLLRLAAQDGSISEFVGVKQ